MTNTDVKSAVVDMLKTLTQTDFDLRDEATVIALATKLMLLVQRCYASRKGAYKQAVVLGVITFIIENRIKNIELKRALGQFVAVALPSIIDAIVETARKTDFSSCAKRCSQFFTACCDSDCCKKK